MLESRPTTLFTLPSSDRAFAAYVEWISALEPPASPVALESRLRVVYPRTVVRTRGLSSDDHTWYVYREGRWVDGRVPDWWQDPTLPRLEVDADGFIAAANETAGAELGLEPDRLLHRHFTDFAVPGTLADALLLQRILLEVGEAGGTIRYLRADGEVRISEVRAIATPAGSTIVVRPVSVEGPIAHARPTVKLETVPSSDRLFAGLVDGIFSRIPEPTPEGLELRLRRSYRHATVTAVDGDRWRVARDPRPSHDPIDWDDPALPSIVALDTSLIVEANSPALELFGQDLVGRHWQDLATPRSLDQRQHMHDFYVENGGAESTFRLRLGPDRSVDYDYRITWQGDRFTTVLRPYEVGVLDGADDETPILAGAPILGG